MTAEDHLATVSFPVFVTEFVVIFIINAVSITGFARIRHLRKRSTYLIINLTVADLLVGAVSGLFLVYKINESSKDEENRRFTWSQVFFSAVKFTFPVASQVNLCLISLDRLHATLFPFRHCLIGIWFYFKVILASWFIAFLLAFLMAYLYFNTLDGLSYAWASFGILTILVLAVSYVTIVVNVQNNPHSQPHGSINTERKLTVTLFIVTGLSVLTILPWAIYSSMPVDLQEKWSNTSHIDVHGVLSVIYFASSIVNPLVYAIRMQEFRKAIRNLVCKRTDPDNVHPLPHHAMEMQ